MHRRIAAAVLCAAVLGVVTAVPQAASTTDAAALALTVPTTSDSGLDPTDVVLTDAEGRFVFDLTTATGGVTGRTVDREPAWSPDGGRVAFVRRDREPVIHVADADGVNLRRLVDGWAPTWSPDGRRIAFRQPASIAVVDSDGSRLRVVGTRAYGSAGPEWSPDGQAVLYGCDGREPPQTTGPADLCLADPDGATPTRTVWHEQPGRGRALGASFSPDGRSIAVMADGGVHVIDVETGDARRLSPIRSVFFYTTPVWSPDGRRIAFVGYLLGHCCVGRGRVTWVDIYSVDADGSGLRRLTGVRDRPPASNPFPDSIGGGLEPASVSPDWWPNGSRLFFARFHWPPQAPGIYTMNADGTCETPFLLHDVPVRSDAVSPSGPVWRPGAHPPSSPLACVDLGLAPKQGQDTGSTLDYPHVVVHELVPYTVTVKNDGTLPATGLVLEIRATGSARIVVAPSTCTRRRATVTCRLPHELPPGGAVPFELMTEATDPSGAHGELTVRVSSREGFAESNSLNNEVEFTTWVRPRSVAGAAPAAPIVGTDAGETLFGRRGGDVIRGRAGDDHVYAGDGNDRIDGGDGVDVIHCGRGMDRVVADPDDAVARDCEQVRRRV
jgi:Tol biopolymer transport system component